MERQLILRNVVCPAQVKPSAFGVTAFEEALDLGVREDKLLLEDLSVTEWEAVRLQILPERLQLGFKENADSDSVRRAVASFLARLDELSLTEKLGFNAALLLTLSDGDRDPSDGLVNAEALAESLGGDHGRGGLTIVYRDATSRWWIELSPQPDDEGQWVFDFNRQFEKMPQIGPGRDALVDWFADIEAGLISQFETICLGVDNENDA